MAQPENSSDTATLVVTAITKPDEMPSVQAYLQGVMPLLIGAGGQPVKRLKVSDVINGKPASMILVMDFPSRQAVTELFASDAYAKLIEVRDTGFREMNIMCAGQM